MIRKPTIPGEFIRRDILEPNGMTQDDLAKRLGVSRLTINELVGGKRIVTPPMAIRLGKLTGQRPEFWLNLQAAVDLWEAQQDRAFVEAVDGIEPLPGL